MRKRLVIVLFCFALGVLSGCGHHDDAPKASDGAAGESVQLDAEGKPIAPSQKDCPNGLCPRKTK